MTTDPRYPIGRFEPRTAYGADELRAAVDAIAAAPATVREAVRGLTAEQVPREYVHPERGVVNLASTVALYAWHGRHHAGHITALRDRRGW